MNFLLPYFHPTFYLTIYFDSDFNYCSLLYRESTFTKIGFNY